MQFVPLWTNIARSRKVAALPDDLYRTWTLCLVTAQEHDHKNGSLPTADDLAYFLHMDTEELMSRLSRLSRSGFLDVQDGVYYVHDWQDWKHRPDPTAAARKRAERDRKKSQVLPKVEVTDDSKGDEPSSDVTVTAVTSQMSQCHAPTQLNSTQLQHTQGHDVTVTPVTSVTPESVCACEPLEPFEPPPESPQAAWSQEQRRVLDKAVRWWGASNGDSVVGSLLETYPVAMVDEAIDSHHGKVNQALHPGRLAGLCRTIWDEGRWKPKSARPNGTGESMNSRPVARPLPPERKATAEDEARAARDMAAYLARNGSRPRPTT